MKLPNTLWWWISMIVATGFIVVGGLMIVAGVTAPMKVVIDGKRYGTGGAGGLFFAAVGAVLCGVGGLGALVQLVRLRAANRRERNLSLGRL
jgi:hypothetical protein